MSAKRTDIQSMIIAVILTTYFVPLLGFIIVFGHFIFLGKTPDFVLLVGAPFILLNLSFAILQAYRGLVIQNMLQLKRKSYFSLSKGLNSARVTGDEAVILGLFWYAVALTAAVITVIGLFPYLTDIIG